MFSSEQCPIFFLFCSFASMRELLIYSSDVEIIFPSNLYTHFVSTSGVINLIQFSQRSIVYMHGIHHRHNNRDCNVGIWNVFHTSILFFLIARNNPKRPFVFYPDHAINLNPFTVQNALQSPLDVFL